MKRFADLFTALDQTTKTNTKVAALADYFRDAADNDRLWTIALLSGRRPKRAVTTTKLREWAAERAGIPLWLFEEAYPIVGDLAETIALVLPPPSTKTNLSLSEHVAAIRALDKADDDTRKANILTTWDGLDRTERFVFNKLITGGFRMGVSRKLMTRALAQATEREEADLAHRLMGDWTPDNVSYDALINAPDPTADLSKPYPFYLAYQLDDPPETLGAPEDWAAEWKWDGIRGQLIRRGGAYFLWSRGEDLMTDRFPELAQAVDFLPDGTVIDGELLAFTEGAPLSFNALQKRIGRKSVPKKLLAEAPVILMAYDLLEDGGADIRDTPFDTRRARLEAQIAGVPDSAPLRLSPAVPFDDWTTL
ncbi:MAG: ATP-dependent DNA ligase, partial [Planctomycetota bacterium]